MEKTKASNFVYRIVCALMIAGSAFFLARAIQYADSLKTISDLTTASGVAHIQFYSGNLAFLFATIAILMRSGAVIWLVALFGFVKIWSPLVVLRDDGYFASFRFDVTAGAFLIPALCALFWLVKKEEIRRP